MIYILIVTAVFVLDLFIKGKIEERFSEKEQRLICGGRIKLRKLHNHGAAMNVMDKKPQRVRFVSGIITAGTAMCFIMLLFRKGYYLLKGGLALLLGGALSNLYDRYKRGYVIDYFSFQTKYRRLRRIVFNLSDMFIFLGAIMIAVWGFATKD